MPRKCVKVFHQINGCLATKDNRNSWGISITPADHRTIMTTELTVMISMDPHIIRVTWIGMVGMLGWFVSYSFRSNYHSGLCGRFNVAFRGEELVV
jgi:hypothetical protein